MIVDIHIAHDLKENDVFANKEILLMCFYFKAVKENFEFKTLRTISRSIEFFQCIQDGCQWYVRAYCYKGSDLWMLRKLINILDCSMNSINSDFSPAHASSSLIGNCLEK